MRSRLPRTFASGREEFLTLWKRVRGHEECHESLYTGYIVQKSDVWTLCFRSQATAALSSHAPGLWAACSALPMERHGDVFSTLCVLHFAWTLLKQCGSQALLAWLGRHGQRDRSKIIKGYERHPDKCLWASECTVAALFTGETLKH